MELINKGDKVVFTDTENELRRGEIIGKYEREEYGVELYHIKTESGQIYYNISPVNIEKR